MARLFVVGANRGVGYHFTELALQDKKFVKAFVRKPSPELEELQRKAGEQLEIIEGDVLKESDFDKLCESMKGCDGIFTSLGGTTIMKRETIISEGTRNILIAAKSANVHKLCKISSWGVKSEPYDSYFFKYFICWLLKYPLEDHLVADTEISQFAEKENFQFDYTIVAPPGLRNAPLTEKYTQQEGVYSLQGAGKNSWISRADVAHFCLHRVFNEGKHSNTNVAINGVH